MRNVLQRFVPFLVTFFLGIFVASLFSAGTCSTSYFKKEYKQKPNYQYDYESSCDKKRKMKRQYREEMNVPPPAVAPERIYPPDAPVRQAPLNQNEREFFEKTAKEMKK